MAENNLITIKLRKPVNYNGKEYTELSFDFDKLTGADGLNIEQELRDAGQGVIVSPAFNGEYLVRMAAKACTEPVNSDIFGIMSLPDSNRIRSEARSFLLTTAE